MEFHPAADSFPMMDDKRFIDLVDDIRANGLRQPITLCDGLILDGRNRYRACLKLGIEPATIPFVGDPWAYAWSLNGARRDLVAEQRYLIWKFCHEHSESWLAEKRRIQDEANRKRSEATREQPRNADGTMGEKPVVQQSVALPVRSKSQRELEAEAITGCVLEDPVLRPATQAKAAASKTNAGAVQRGDVLANRRPDLAEKVRKGDIKPAEAHRQMKRDEVSGKVSELPAGKYRVIYADPPWKYGDSQAVKGDYGTGTGAANSHYPSMSLSELKALDIPELSTENAVLFLWATCPLLEDALELCRAWGFTYKAQFVWDKVKHNMGHYNSVRHELLLICTRGSCTPDNVKLFDSVQSIERAEHSRKPEEFRAIIDTLYPHGPRIELFRRGDVPDGWETWGNEAEEQDAA